MGAVQRGGPAEGSGRRVPCVGAVVRDAAGRLLLVQRGRPPGLGLWSLPGGRVEAGESDAQALTREVREETGLEVRVGPLVGRVERAGPAGSVYVIADHACEVTGGRLSAGDDAADVRWVGRDDLASLPVTDGLLDTLAGWGVLPAP
ncbi:MAG: NUDIX hydrolase [Actinomycetes bacterium]